MKAKQKALERILVGTDFTRPAARAVVRAAMLAAEHSARLEIVHVTPRLDREALKKLVGRSPGAGPGLMTKRHLEETRALAREHGCAATVKFLEGSAADTLSSEAARIAADLVVVGCRGKRSFKDALIGTTAERLLERWPGDTLVVRNAPRSAYGTILACVALAPVSCSVVMSAVAVSAHARLQVLHVYLASVEMKLLSHYASSEALARHRAARKREAAQGLAELIEQCPVPPGRQLEPILRYGTPSQIPGIAARRGADVIVVGRNQSVLERFFLGSVTKRVVRSASSDVLVSDPR